MPICPVATSRSDPGTDLFSYQNQVDAAVSNYWSVRQSQAKRSRASGVLNTGIRAEVTGGRHLDALQELVVSVFVDAGIPAHLIDVKSGRSPGTSDGVNGRQQPGAELQQPAGLGARPGARCLEGRRARDCRRPPAPVAWLVHAPGRQRRVQHHREGPSLKEPLTPTATSSSSSGWYGNGCSTQLASSWAPWRAVDFSAAGEE